jgi:hypothetical protein
VTCEERIIVNDGSTVNGCTAIVIPIWAKETTPCISVNISKSKATSSKCSYIYEYLYWAVRLSLISLGILINKCLCREYFMSAWGNKTGNAGWNKELEFEFFKTFLGYIIIHTKTIRQSNWYNTLKRSSIFVSNYPIQQCKLSPEQRLQITLGHI